MRQEARPAAEVRWSALFAGSERGDHAPDATPCRWCRSGWPRRALRPSTVHRIALTCVRAVAPVAAGPAAHSCPVQSHRGWTTGRPQRTPTRRTGGGEGRRAGAGRKGARHACSYETTKPAPFTHQILPHAAVPNRRSQRIGPTLTCAFSADQQESTLQDQIAVTGSSPLGGASSQVRMLAPAVWPAPENPVSGFT